MDRKKVVEFLRSQLKKLKEEEHVEDLMKHGRIDELKEVAEEMDYSMLDEFCIEDDLDLEMDEIPLEGYEYEMVFYAMYSELDDLEIFADDDDFIELLEAKNEKIASKIVELMFLNDLSEITIEELLAD